MAAVAPDPVFLQAAGTRWSGISDCSGQSGGLGPNVKHSRRARRRRASTGKGQGARALLSTGANAEPDRIEESPPDTGAERPRGAQRPLGAGVAAKGGAGAARGRPPAGAAVRRQRNAAAGAGCGGPV